MAVDGAVRAALVGGGVLHGESKAVLRPYSVQPSAVHDRQPACMHACVHGGGALLLPVILEALRAALLSLRRLVASVADGYRRLPLAAVALGRRERRRGLESVESPLLTYRSCGTILTPCMKSVTP